MKLKETDLKTDVYSDITLSNIHCNKLLDICSSILPDTLDTYSCIYKIDYDKVRCYYNLSNNYGSTRGSGVHWLEFCISKLFNILELSVTEKLEFITLITSVDSLHPIDFLYSIFESRIRSYKIDKILD